MKKTVAMVEFTKNDWYAFAGAERFEDGGEPLIAQYGPLTVIVDADGVQSTINAFEDTEKCYVIRTRDKEYNIEMAQEILRTMKGKTPSQMARTFEQFFALENQM